mmetsp:Transcript_9520/g.18042  ORF Transcript_9520/g.18042 Transcript_9520/m.18042 type:complete len:1135 (-) Transcript_9520:195-3599(-)
MSGEAVKVVVRCRPMNTKEKNLGCDKIVKVHRDIFQIQLVKADDPDGTKSFTFDSVFDDDSTQEGVYQDTAFPLVHSVMDGYNGTIFAYGQTGCGKTFTMEGVRGGPEHLKGIIPKSFEQIFRLIDLNDEPGKQFLVQAAYIEIYNEEVRDLLGSDPKARLELKESSDRGVYVKDLSQNIVKGCDHLQDLMAAGNANRTVGATLMNADSSRSHSIFMVRIETSEPDPNKPGETKIKAGKLNLVDLAGSERQGKTGAAGVRLKEATKINLSLSALGNVIQALCAGKGKHIPYRDSKLTRLLQDSLGGNTKTVMIAALSPADYNYDETLSTLRYANRAKNIKNKPKINEDPKDAMLREYQDEIKRLKAMLEAEGLSADGPTPHPPTGVPPKRKKKKKKKVRRSRRRSSGGGGEGGGGREDGEEDEGDEEEDEDYNEEYSVSKRDKQVDLVEKQKELEQRAAQELEDARKAMESEMARLASEKEDHEKIASSLAEKLKEEAAVREQLTSEIESKSSTIKQTSAMIEAERIKREQLAKEADARMVNDMEKHEKLAEELSRKMQIEAEKHEAIRLQIEETKANMRDEKRTLKEKLKELTEQLIQGGQKAKDIELKQQEDLKRAAAEVEENRRRQAALKEAAEKLEEEKLLLEENYSTIKEEVDGKTRKLQKLGNKYDDVRTELRDLQHEFEVEKEGYLGSIRDAYKDLRLHKRIVQIFLLRQDLDKIVKLSTWNDNISKWELPRIEIPVNLPTLGFGKPKGATEKPSGQNRRKQQGGFHKSAKAEIQDSTAGWKKSIRSEQAEMEHAIRVEKQREAAAKNSNPQPARLTNMGGGENGVALRGTSSTGGAPVKLGAQIEKERRNSQGLLPESIENCRVRPAFEVDRADLPAASGGAGGLDLDSMELPNRRAAFDPSGFKAAGIGGGGAVEDVFESMNAVPRRANFDGGGFGKKTNGFRQQVEPQDDPLAATSNIPRRSAFNVANASTNFGPAGAGGFDSLSQNFPPARASFQPAGFGKGSLELGGGTSNDLLSTMDVPRKRAAFDPTGGGFNGGFGAPAVGSGGVDLDSFDLPKRAAFAPTGGLGGGFGSANRTDDPLFSDEPPRRKAFAPAGFGGDAVERNPLDSMTNLPSRPAFDPGV